MSDLGWIVEKETPDYVILRRYEKATMSDDIVGVEWGLFEGGATPNRIYANPSLSVNVAPSSRWSETSEMEPGTLKVSWTGVFRASPFDAERMRQMLDLALGWVKMAHEAKRKEFGRGHD